MPRPQRCRRICKEPEFSCFHPEDSVTGEDVTLSLDEYETIRLVDFEKLTHEECARRMDVSRTTITEIYESARHKVSDCIVNGKRLRIEGGNYRICDGTAECPCCIGTDTPCNKTEKGENEMRIAVTYENGQVFQHFGHSEMFKLYIVEDGKIVSSELLGTNGSGHGALAALLAENSVDTLICGGIGAGAQAALSEAGIKLCGGVTGDADEAVNAYISGSLNFSASANCNHHSEEHKCGEHGCGNHSCH